MEPLAGVWRTEDRLHTDDATIARLCDLASGDPAIRDVIDDLHPAPAGNGSVWASGITRESRIPALLKLGARDTEREWMTSIDAVTDDVVPHIFGSGELRGVGWLVLERCEFALDRTVWEHVAAVVESSARYQHAATAISAGASTMDLDWLRKILRGAQTLSCPGDLHQPLADLEKSWAFASAQCGLSANHGDVHFGNVVARAAPTDRRSSSTRCRPQRCGSGTPRTWRS